MASLSSLFLLAFLVSLDFLFCSADPTDGFIAVPLTDSNLILQKPYNIPLDQRYSYIDGVRSFWVYDTDEPFKPGSTTEPRTEIRIQGYDYSSGVWQFEGYAFVPNGTTGTNIVQIHRQDGDAHSTTFMLRVYNGQLFDYRTSLVASDIYNKWMRINVIHDVDNNMVTAFIDGAQKLELPGNGVSSFYFKCGVYTQNNPSHYMESRWKDIRILKKDD